jgi:uncharacterized circularly permuted ATP-grasp superfamily protein
MSAAGAIACFQEILTDRLAADSQEQLDRELRRRGLVFGDRPLATVMRPRFLSPDQYARLRGLIGTLLGAFDKVLAKAIGDPLFRREFGLTDWEEELVALDPGFNPSPTGRLDAFWAGEELRFTEYNAETPAGPAYNEALTEVFLGLPILREFLKRFEVRPLPARHHVLHALLDAYLRSGRSGLPRVAIVDWKEVPTYSEFVLFRDYFQSQGLASIIVDPRELSYQNGILTAGDFAVDLVYKRVLISELVGRGGLDQPLIRAVRDGAVPLVNPFRCKILHKKASLAALSDEDNAELFTREELDLIDRHVPWTRRVVERDTFAGGRKVDLVRYILDHRERLVLKPNDEYGGKGIVLGWEVGSSAWEEAVGVALRDPYVVQERVAVPKEPYPAWVDGRLDWSDRMVDTAPFVFYGQWADGCLTRISTAALLNVTAGGGSTIPTFVVEKR